MTGHIQLGKYADTTLRHYVLDDERRLQAATANPYAARVSTGGPYAQLDTFNDWTIQDWHMGVGYKDPENGQMFSLGETRYPNYLMPPPGWTHPLTTWIQTSGVAPTDTPHETPLLSGTWYSVSFTASRTANVENIWILLHCPYDKSVTVGLYTDDAGKPDALLSQVAVTSDQVRVHAHWQRFTLPAAQSLTSGTRYHIVVSTTVTATLGSGIYPYLPTTALGGSEKCYYSTDNGSTWTLYNTTGTKGFYFLLTYSDIGDHYIKGIFIQETAVCVWQENSISRVAAGAYTAEVSGITIYDVKQNGKYLYIAYGTGWKRYDISSDTTVDHAGVTTYAFLIYGGYLWRSNGNTVAYSADETNWTTLDDFSNVTTNDIKGMAGMGGYVYAATAQGLFQVADGDQVVQVLQWPEVVNADYINMVSWENALYIPLEGGTILRYGQDGSLLNVGINAKEELPADLQGTVVNLCPTNYFLLASVDPANWPDSYPSLWAYNVDGWHCLAIGPQSLAAGAVTVDRNNGYLYWGLDSQFLARADYPSSVNNPVRSLADIDLAPEAWVEYERFFGGYRTLLKDFDRIYIDLENPGRNVHVYWQTEDHFGPWPANHNGQVSWQYLGTLASGADTIQFPATSRPVGKNFKLALRLTTTDVAATDEPPVLRGVSVKYSTNVADRWRYVLPILVSDNQQMPDGTINEYTAAQQEAHLLELIAETAPLRYVDVGGTERTVKVTGANRTILRYDWLSPEGEPSIQYVYMITIEQVS